MHFTFQSIDWKKSVQIRFGPLSNPLELNLFIFPFKRVCLENDKHDCNVLDLSISGSDVINWYAEAHASSNDVSRDKSYVQVCYTLLQITNLPRQKRFFKIPDKNNMHVTICRYSIKEILQPVNKNWHVLCTFAKYQHCFEEKNDIRIV